MLIITVKEKMIMTGMIRIEYVDEGNGLWQLTRQEYDDDRN